MTRKERVCRAIKLETPDKVPICFFNRDPLCGDIYLYDLFVSENGRSEWGYSWVTLNDGTMGQPDVPILLNWSGLNSFKWPDPSDSRRLARLESCRAVVDDRYRLASVGISGFNTYMFLRGFENAMRDFLVEQEQAVCLLDKIMDFEIQLFEIAARNGFNGVHLSDDWGTQNGLMISPELWRELFKPRYRRQVEFAHKLGLHVWFHSCGNTAEILPDMNEIAIDVINISQPNVVDLVRVNRDLSGRQCFMVPISYQTVSISGTPEDIYKEAQRLYWLLGTPKGGFIGYVEDYKCMGMAEKNYQACINAFRSLRPINRGIGGTSELITFERARSDIAFM